MPTNPQEEFWSGPAGRTYMMRNNVEAGRLEERVAFFDLFYEFPRDLPILEVGCNVGINLSILRKMGFTNLSGIDIYSSAILVAEKFVPGAHFAVGSILDLPYADEEFGAVFSSGVLIHQDPNESLSRAMSEMSRCSSQYILGFEDYAETFEAPRCYDRHDLYWRGPYNKMWKNPDYRLQLEKRCIQDPPGTLAYFKKGTSAPDMAAATLDSPHIERTEEWGYVRESYRFSKKKKEA